MVRAVVAALLGTLLSSQPAGALDGRPAARALVSATSERGDLTPNQLTAGRTLTREEALAACGPAAAVAFARARGRALTLDEAVAAARAVGWTAERGMAGPRSQVALLERLGIPATLEPTIDRAKVVREVSAGRPVIIHTGNGPGHYLVAERYDAASGRFDFGQSAAVLRLAGARRWFGLDEVGSLGMGIPGEAIYMAGASSAMTRPAAASGAARSPAAAASLRLRVTDTDGQGLNLRAEPSTEAARVKGVREGAELEEIGPARQAGGRSWRSVRDPSDGTSGWAAAEFLAPVR